MAIAGFGDVAEKLRRSTVMVRARNQGGGSGIIWSSNGTILTNAHVARGNKLRVELWDGREFDAAIAKRDPIRDLAALQIDASNLPSADVANSTRIRAGEIAIAIGNPLGFVGALTTGVVHGVGMIRGLGPRSWVQAAIQLAPGNSGGPLANARGALIGINTMVVGRLALAVPSNAVKNFLSGNASDSWLGVTLHPVQVPQTNGPASTKSRFGLVLLAVEPESPASAASLMPGDILLAAEGNPFATMEDLANSLQGSGPRSLRLDFFRGDTVHPRHVTVQLGISRRSSFVGSSVAA